MNTTQQRQALRRAIRVVAGANTPQLQALPYTQATLVLYTLTFRPEYAPVCRQLANQLQARLSEDRIDIGDLEEVFGILSALWQYDPTRITAKQFDLAIRRLIRAEARVGGPYRVGATIPIAANAWIAIFLRMIASTPPRVVAFLSDAIAEKRVPDLYAQYLLAEAGYYELVIKYNPHLIKRLARTTDITSSAIIISLLSPKPAPITITLQRKQSRIVYAAKHPFASCAKSLRETAHSLIDQLAAADTNAEIALHAYFFAHSLKIRPSLTATQYKHLGMANTYTWLAYTLFDDALDGEYAPAHIPVAVMAQRLALTFLQGALPKDAAFHRYIAETFTHMDEANAWEIHRCRFTPGQPPQLAQLPAYGNRSVLAKRALGHFLPCAAILALSGKSLYSRQQLETAFRHYLIARQLIDDLHDWQKDFQAGHATYVVTAILKNMPSQLDKPPTLLLRAMQREFRARTMAQICACIQHHIDTSRAMFAKNRLLQKENHFQYLLNRLERIVVQSLDRQKKSKHLKHVAD